MAVGDDMDGFGKMLGVVFSSVGIPTFITLILKSTGTAMAAAMALSFYGAVFTNIGIGLSAFGFGLGIYLLAKENLLSGSLLTLVSGIMLGLTIGALVGALVPWVGGPVIGLLVGAGIGLLVALLPVALACVRACIKKPTQEETSNADFADAQTSEEHSPSVSRLQNQHQHHHTRSGAFFDSHEKETSYNSSQGPLASW